MNEGRTYLPAKLVLGAFGYPAEWKPPHTVLISRADWSNPFSVWVFDQPPLDYLDQVGATGTIWSVFFWGRNPEEEPYVQKLHAAGYRVLSNLPSGQGSMWLSQEGEWRGLDPALIEAGACRKNDGSIVYFDVGTESLKIAYMDINSQAWMQHLQAMVTDHIEGGADGILIDELQNEAISVFYGGNFSQAAMKAFRDHLAQKFSSEELRSRFGIDDVASLDYGRYLAARGLNSAYDDPNPELLREYLRFTYASRVSHLRELIDSAKQQAGPNLIMAGNAYQFGPMYQPILPLLDLIVSEIPMETLPEGKHAGLYLLARSIGGSKPVAGFPDIYTLANLSSQDYDLWRHWMAEALSCGGTIIIPYQAFTMGGGSFTLPANEIAPYTRFLREHPELYTPCAKSPATVAVLYDLG